MSHCKYIWQRKSWPDFKWSDSIILPYLSQARKKQGQLMTKANQIGLDVQAQFLSEDALKTSAIEGERLDPESVRSSVARRLGLPQAGLLPQERHIEGLVEMLWDATQNYHLALSLKRLCGWQAGLFPTGYSGIHKIHVGKLRTAAQPMQVISGPIGKEAVHFEGPPAKQVPKEIEAFLEWFNTEQKNQDGLIRAAIAHLWFITIHPFDDGNGRVARAITDMCLAQDDSQKQRYYSLSSQINKERNSYYNILEKTQKSDLDITEWIIWFIENYTQALNASEVIIDKTKIISTFWAKAISHNLNQRQKKALQKMLDAEPDGFQGGMTNRKYVSITKVSRETAKRDLADLEEKQLIIRNDGLGRSISYRLNLV